ncbi:uncharacterized protein LOC101852190 [Aplysia californica]|uniref:Uncharacterized protein LOC101852190 n=1 Tax=Aplysia californica TaxID=6500 RepID=A0ABM0JV77_APLCA|nr:uncharacterized protein LOC101852190 [Aplysia californica]
MMYLSVPDMMGKCRVFTIVVLCLWFLPMVCLACSRGPRPELETKFCPSRKNLIKGFPGGISEHSMKNPRCVKALSSISNTRSTVDNYWSSLDSAYKWVLCPAGYFLQGFKFAKNGDGIYALHEGLCSKDVDSPSTYEHCYRQDAKVSTMCLKDYFVTGILRDSCSDWSCVLRLRCCKQSSSSEFTISSVEAAKKKVMLQSLDGLAQIASYLGYDGVKGCFGQVAGDDFVANGTAWVAKKCMHDDSPQLKIGYEDWKFRRSGLSYLMQETIDLPPEEIESGVFINDGPVPILETVTQRHKMLRTVRHTLMSPWEGADMLGVKLIYYPEWMTGDFRGLFNFDITTERDKEITKEINNTTKWIKRDTELQPNTTSRWTAKLYKKLTTQHYQVTVRIDCSAKFEGRLRNEIAQLCVCSDSLKRYTHRNEDDVLYQFGGENRPFYLALSDEKKAWDNWISDRQMMGKLVEELADHERYEFVLEGKFEETYSYNIDIEFNDTDTRLDASA